MQVMISVVVPTYKRPALLARCMHAILNQSFSKNNYEIIVVSDGPDESTKFMVDLVQGEDRLSNITYLALSEKKGPAAARNLGWRYASGNLIVFTDDDCIPDSNWLQAFWDGYQQEGDKPIAFTGKVFVPLSHKPTDYEKNISMLETASFITANCACSKSALETVNGFDEDFSLAWREDSALEFKFIDHHIPIKKIDAAKLDHPVRRASWGISLWEQKKGMFNALLFKKFPEHYKNKIAAQPLWNYYIMVVSFVISIIYFLLQEPLIGVYFFLIWLVFLAEFIFRRLKGTTHTFSHVFEMIATSICIPFVSIYWTIIGAIRFKVFHL